MAEPATALTAVPAPRDWLTQDAHDTARPNELSGAEKRALLASILRKKKSEPRSFPPSYAQQRLWFLDRLAPGNCAYNSIAAVHIEQPLDVEVLERVLNEIVRRHGALRTNFKEVNGEPVQVVVPHVTLPLQIIDLSALPPVEGEAEMMRIAAAEARRPYNLANDLLVRATLLRLGETHHVFLLGTHHIIADGWSMTVFATELTTLYACFIAGQPSPLPELSIQYTDFAVWQRNWLRGEVLENQLAYWKKQLAAAPVLQLPTDYPRPAVPGFRGATYNFSLPASLSNALNQFSRDQGVTLFMTLLAAFKTLLHRYASQDDIVVGVPIANRERTELEGLIGFFVNMLAMRTDLGGNPSFRELLTRVREVALKAYAHQSIPFEKLVEEVRPGRDVSRNPLFQVTFQLFKNFDSAQPSAAPAPRVAPIEPGTAIFDLALDLIEAPNGIKAQFQYSTELFKETTIARMAEHLQILLEGIAANPDAPISDLPLITRTERRRLLIDWNQTSADYPRERCVYDLFEEQAERSPDRLAVACGTSQLSYGELSQRANRLARHLQRSGIGPGSLVSILLERSADLVIAILATFKTGAAYLPLDPACPEERLRFMLEDSKARIILTEARLSVLAGETQTICLDRDWQIIEQAVEPGLFPRVPPESLAYVIYTSGSTGRPRGVEICHGGLVNLVAWHQKTYGVTPEDRATLVASPSFDASVWEMWPYLTGGASIHIPDDTTRAAPARLAQWIAATGITLCFLPTPLAESILDEPWPPVLALRALLTGGDRLRRHPSAALPFRLYNHYGPTENTVVSTWSEVEPASHVALPPIGRPIANTAAYVLDTYLNPVPIGFPGELCVSGDGLALGYLNRPELTAEKFVPNPFDRGARLYKTGDLVRWREDGNLEFLGRLDHQVKLRGFRIEPGEIESILNQHPEVRQSVVNLYKDSDNEQRLVAYVAPALAPDPSQSGEQVGHWSKIYDELYGEPAADADFTFNIIGWQSSYTGEPIPHAEMLEQVCHTVEKISHLRPRHVLEIGCGTGLLLFRLAADCASYHGRDFSKVAIEDLQKKISRLDFPHVHLSVAEATDFSGVEPGSVDLVILNSVAQYFPDFEYLRQVLLGAVRAVRDGGHLFVGDVRSLPLLRAFRTAVELHRATDELPAAELRRRVQARIVHEEELVVDPRFFAALSKIEPRVTGVAMELKRGIHRNELTQFRYDVILQIGGPTVADGPIKRIPWTEISSLERLDETLKSDRSGRLVIAGIPNARVWPEVHAARRLWEQPEPGTAGDLRKSATSISPSVDPEMLFEAAQRTGRRAQLYLSESGGPDLFDAHFPDGTGPLWSRGNAAPETPANISQWTNTPVAGERARELPARLIAHLKERLPQYMVPASIILLDHLPLTPHGKIDRRALPPPEGERPQLASVFVAPRNDLEEKIAALWRELLRVEKVGVNDNFFDLGGHSLLLVRLHSRLQTQFQAELSIIDLFRYPTVSSLARLFSSEEAAAAPADHDERALNRRKALSHGKTANKRQEDEP